MGSVTAQGYCPALQSPTRSERETLTTKGWRVSASLNMAPPLSSPFAVWPLSLQICSPLLRLIPSQEASLLDCTFICVCQGVVSAVLIRGLPRSVLISWGCQQRHPSIDEIIIGLCLNLRLIRCFADRFTARPLRLPPRRPRQSTRVQRCIYRYFVLYAIHAKTLHPREVANSLASSPPGRSRRSWPSWHLCTSSPGPPARACTPFSQNLTRAPTPARAVAAAASVIYIFIYK